ncbi:microviridin/marinostatin family tricyclic proteinase inhibitor [Ancylomarina sp. DW003]|nr:microviridin/marinostatin family tricyclic proteinase inhibitor [Ancylomarina sp. DW003]MDE5422015.1 microviridin/marinostatin family tricyclic proteinase inhibitor [Ancylomarina sp. DW003]
MKKPFFANFLENQVNEDEIQQVKGGLTPESATKLPDLDQTMKYPSDNDEGLQTMKYPSDNDEGNINLM